MSNESDTEMTDSADVQNEAMDFDIPEEMETPQETPEAEAAEETSEPEMKRQFCRNCGQPLVNPDAKFCYKCGHVQEQIHPEA